MMREWNRGACYTVAMALILGLGCDDLNLRGSSGGASSEERGSSGDRIASLRQFLHSPVSSLDELEDRARYALSNGLLPDAVDLYLNVLDQDPKRDRARLGLANVLWDLGMTRRSLEEVRMVLRRSPDNKQALARLGYMLVERKGGAKAWEEAVEAWRHFLQLASPTDPQFPEVRERLFELEQAMSRPLESGKASPLIRKDGMPVKN